MSEDPIIKQVEEICKAVVSLVAELRRESRREGMGDDAKQVLGSVTDKDRDILQAALDKPATTQALARRCGTTSNSSFRNRMAELKRRGMLGKVRGKGYQTTELGRMALIASAEKTRQDAIEE